jgi:hypothetical protein
VAAIEKGMTYGNQHLANAWIVRTTSSGERFVAGVATFANGNTYGGAWAVDTSGRITAVSNWATVYSNWPDATETGGLRTDDEVNAAIGTCAG